MLPEERLEYWGIKKCKLTEALFRSVKSHRTPDDVPEGFVRFFHGTASSSALTIVEDGIIEGKLAYESDFGPAFYCAESLHLAMLYSIYSMQFNDSDSRGAVMAFDVPQEEFNKLVALRVEGPTWKTMVSLCQAGKAQKVRVTVF
eukprot:scaffold28361_cov51-Attheya_sp.AAC.2